MAEKDLIVDSVNLSSYYPPGVNYTVDYEFVSGGQGGIMLTGAETVDELMQKEIILFPLFPLTDAQAQTVLSLVMPNPIHTVHYYSPWKGERTIQMIRSVKKVKYRGKGASGYEYWTGFELQFREKG